MRLAYNAALIPQAPYFDLWNKLFNTMPVAPTIPARPNPPEVPPPYLGPQLSATDSYYNFGYGKLSAGMLSISEGGKSFGVLGQGNEQFDTQVPPKPILNTACLYGYKRPAEDDTDCAASYIALSVFSLGNKVAGDVLKINMGSYYWSSLSDILQTPAAPEPALLTN